MNPLPARGGRGGRGGDNSEYLPPLGGGTGWEPPPIGAPTSPIPSRLSEAPGKTESEPDHSGPFVAPPGRWDERPLKGGNPSDGSADADAFEERAAIREYDGGLSRAAAERLAALDIITSRATRPATFNPLA